MYDPDQENELGDTQFAVRIATFNTNSVYQHFDELCDIPADVLVCPESRVSSRDVHLMERAAAAKGFQMSARSLAPDENGRIANAGVTIFARHPLRLRPLQLDEVLTRWCMAGRLDAVQVMAPGGVSFTLFGHYAWADWRNDHDHQADLCALYEHLTEWKHENGLRGCVLAGDFNAQPNELPYQTISHLMEWRDAHYQHDQPRADTYVGASGSTVIDHVFLDAQMAGALQQATTQIVGTAQHRAVCVACHLDVRGEIWQPTMPRSDPRMLIKLPEESEPGWRWEHLRDRLYAQVLHGDVEGSWQTWSRRWEELLCVRAQRQGASLTAASRGRGTLPRRTNGLFRVPAFGQPCHETVKLRQFRKTLNLCREARFQYDRYGWIEAGLWKHLVRKLQQCRMCQVDAEPSLDLRSLLEFEDRLGVQIAEQQATLKADRRQRWVTSLSTSGMKRAFAFVTSKATSTLQGFTNSAGNVAYTENEMTQTLNEFWEKVHSTEDCLDSEVINSLLDGPYNDFVVPTEWVPDVTGADLAAAVAAMRSSASPGPGGWRIGEMKTLPAMAWEEYSHMLHLYERDGMPTPLKEIWVSLLPKSEEKAFPCAHDVRPISVGAAMYRLYSRAKAATLQPLLEKNLHPSQWGGRPKRGVMQAVAEVVTKIEYAKAQRKDLMGLSIDIQKFFDAVPTGSVATLLMLIGADEGTSLIVQRVMMGMRRRWKLPNRTLTDYIKIQRGVAQGCSLSLTIANVLIAAFLRYVLRGMDAGVKAVAYVDDVIFLMESEETLTKVWERVLAFTNLVGLAVNRKKSFVFSTCPTRAAQWARQGTPIGLDIKRVFTHLGVLVQATPGVGDDDPVLRQKAQELHHKAMVRLPRIRSLPLAADQRALLASSAVQSAVLFAPWGWRWSPKIWSAYRTTMLATIQGKMVPKARAAREVSFHLLHRGHRLDPAVALADTAVRWLACFHQQAEQALRWLWAENSADLVDMLRKYVSATGLAEHGYLCWRSGGGVVFDLAGELTSSPRTKVWHQWRGCVRDQVWHLLSLRRPIFDGIALVNRKVTLKLQHKLSARERGAFHCVLTDGLLTKSRLSNYQEERQCSLCQIEETPSHVYWECPRWAQWREVQLHQILHLPPATRLCGLLLQNQGRLEVQVQEQLFRIAWHYIQSRPAPVRQPVHGPPRVQPRQPEQPRVPLYRINKKSSPGALPSLPAKPLNGVWAERGHTGRVIRHKLAWKVYCDTCSRMAKWERRHRMPPCQGQLRGQRIAVPDGFSKLEENGTLKVRCEACLATSLWVSQARFVRRHRCKTDENGDVVIQLARAEQLARESALGFARHEIVPAGDEWTCTVCTRTLKRRQSLAQSWCVFPAWASPYLYA